MVGEVPSGDATNVEVSEGLAEAAEESGADKKRVSGFCLSGHVWNRDIYIYYHIYIHILHIIYIYVIYIYYIYIYIYIIYYIYIKGFTVIFE